MEAAGPARPPRPPHSGWWIQPSLSRSSLSWDASGVRGHAGGTAPPAFSCSSWDGCRAVCTPGAAQTRRAAGWELYGAAAVKDRQGGRSPPAPVAPAAAPARRCAGDHSSHRVPLRHGKGWPSPGFDVLMGTSFLGTHLRQGWGSRGGSVQGQACAAGSSTTLSQPLSSRSCCGSGCALRGP